MAFQICLFVLCFAPAAAMFALTLEWARPAAPPAPKLVYLLVPVGAGAAETLSDVSSPGTTEETPHETSALAMASVERSSVAIVKSGGETHNFFREAADRIGAPLADYPTRRVAMTIPVRESFHDRLTRSGAVALGLGLVTLTGGIGMSIFQRRRANGA